MKVVEARAAYDDDDGCRDYGGRRVDRPFGALVFAVLGTALVCPVPSGCYFWSQPKLVPRSPRCHPFIFI